MTDPLRQEKATLRGQVAGSGGTLTLTQDKLVWKFRGGSKARGFLEFDLRTTTFTLGPRRPGWLQIILMPAWGWLLELLTGGFRKTLRVQPHDVYRYGAEGYYFSVKDASSWLNAIAEQVRNQRM